MPTGKTLYWLLAAATLYLIAWNVGSGWLYVLTVLLTAFPLASLILSRINIRRIEPRLEVPPSTTDGEMLPATLEITNPSYWPRFFLDLDCRYAGSRQRLFLPLLGPRESRRISYVFDQPRRGLYSGADVKISSAAPVGLARSRRRLETNSPIVVYPRRHQLAGDWASGYKNTGYMVASALATRNTASDYLGVRDYRSGDNPRSIHWRTSARTGSLDVIEYARQSAMTPVFLVDTFFEADRGKGMASTFETAVTIAASLAQREAIHKRRFAIGFSPEDAAARGLSHSAEESMFWLAGVNATSDAPMDLQSKALPWPEITPVLLLTSHPAYARLGQSTILEDFPHSIIIMLDGREFEKDARPRTPLMDDTALDQLAERLDTMGAEFLLVTSPDEVPLCLNDL